MTDPILDPIMDALDRMPTLRDQFAMAALTGLVMHEEFPTLSPKIAYEIADLMLEARKKGQAE